MTNPVGRPRKDFDIEQLLAMVRIQCTQDECCSVLGITEPTLDARVKEAGYENFLDFYKQHSGEGKMSLRRAQFRLAVEESNPTMLIWLGKQHLGQRDKSSTEMSGVDGGPIQTEDVSARDRIASRLARIAPGAGTAGDTGGPDAD